MAIIQNHKDTLLQAATIRITPAANITSSDLDAALLQSITDAITSATNAQQAATAIGYIADDNLLTAQEKTALSAGWAVVQSEYTEMSVLATSLSIGAELTSYNSTYTLLSNFVSPLLISMATDSPVDGVAFSAHIANYYTARDVLNAKLTDSAVGGDLGTNITGQASTSQIQDYAISDFAVAVNYTTTTLSQTVSMSIDCQNKPVILFGEVILAAAGLCTAGSEGASHVDVSLTNNGVDVFTPGLLARLANTSTAEFQQMPVARSLLILLPGLGVRNFVFTATYGNTGTGTVGGYISNTSISITLLKK